MSSKTATVLLTMPGMMTTVAESPTNEHLLGFSIPDNNEFSIQIGRPADNSINPAAS